jgi:hypothetical protein
MNFPQRDTTKFNDNPDSNLFDSFEKQFQNIRLNDDNSQPPERSLVNSFLLKIIMFFLIY